ncbi:hypothetical protein AWM79_15725 [Pseudomonas agarici]|uniref:Uncharacterized protein n=1 Tax=Pseudomonas agarici TaxID=46677 RepID=A0A0X1T3M6_PSEAA|nr:hypothetical protein [Pseudomonas agarici]AMB86674.1 hypothetical protein AWM79_15725 [Pseudomonas agarici]
MTPAQIISSLTAKIATAGNVAMIDCAHDFARGAIYTLHNLGLITIDTWRLATDECELLAERQLTEVGGSA